MAKLVACNLIELCLCFLVCVCVPKVELTCGLWGMSGNIYLINSSFMYSVKSHEAVTGFMYLHLYVYCKLLYCGYYLIPFQFPSAWSGSEDVL